MAVSTVKLNGTTLMTVNDTTATASDVAQSKYFYAANGVKTAGTNSGGGGGGAVEEKDVNFYDYDGTLLYSYTATQASALSALPANPSHTGLTAQGWNYTLAEIKTEVTTQGKCNIGQTYITDDGKTRIYVHFEEGRTSPYLGICPNGTVTIDWGDSSATDTLTGTSLTTIKTVQHSYASAGDYIITLKVESGEFAFYGTSSLPYILRKDTSTTANINKVYANSVKKVELGSNAKLRSYAFIYCTNLLTITIPLSALDLELSSPFQYCYNLKCLVFPKTTTVLGTNFASYCFSLKIISIPSSVTSLGYSGTFRDSRSLESIVIPSTVTTFGAGGSTFYNDYNLKNVILPNSITTIANSGFRECHSLASISIPNGVTTFGGMAFYNCYCLSSVTIPSSVTSFGSSGDFSGCYGMKEYHLLPTTPPTLASGAFNNISSDCIIYVPQGCLSAYQTATNWSTYASYMQEEPS